MYIQKTRKSSKRIETTVRNSRSRDRQQTLERKQKRALKYQTTSTL